VHVLSVSDRGKYRRTCSSLFPLRLYAAHLVTPDVLGRLAADEVKQVTVELQESLPDELGV
jgi:hypothetical protein